MRTVGVIPFFGGEKTVDEEVKERNLSWLTQTVESMAEYCDDIIIGVCTTADELQANSTVSIGPCTVAMIDCPPRLLPINTCRHIQSLAIENALILYSEADQVFHIRDMNVLSNLVASNPHAYVAPHRCVRLVGNEEFGSWERFGHHIPTGDGSHPTHYLFLRERFFYNDYEYVVDNKPHAMLWNNEKFSMVIDDHAYHYGFFMHSRVVSGMFYINTIEGCAYGASYLCHADLFNRIEFIEPKEFPLEHASGFAIFNTEGVTPLKTLNNEYFWVDHLSHREGNTSTWA